MCLHFAGGLNSVPAKTGEVKRENISRKPIADKKGKAINLCKFPNWVSSLKGWMSVWRPLTACLIVVGLMLGSAAVAAGSSFKVGSFTKSTGVAPASQDVAHGLGETPKALILWTAAKTTETLSGDYRFAMGVTDGTTGKSVAVAGDNGVTTSNTSRRMANKALTIVQWGGERDRRSRSHLVGCSDFTLKWTTNDAMAAEICYLALGPGFDFRRSL